MEKRKKLRIMHIADMHLDSPFSRLDAEKAEQRRREHRGVFTSMMLYARSHKADIVLIAGDLFDVGYAGEDTVSLIIREFEKAPECRFVIAAGNHDPYFANSVYRLKKFPDNVYIFDSCELSCFTFEELGAQVYGWSFVSDSLEHNPLKGKTAEHNEYIPILCAHCDITSASSKYAPVNVADIERFGAVYSALGHVHRHDGIQKFPSGAAYGYSGCPAGRSFDECGEGGAYISDIECTDDGRWEVAVKFEKFSVSSYEKATLDMTGVMTHGEAESRIAAFISEKGYNDRVSLRLTLRGMTGSDVGTLDGFSAQSMSLFYLEIRDETVPTYDCARLEQDMTVRGAFYRVLLPMLESDDESQREIASEALRVGFAALDGSDITTV